MRSALGAILALALVAAASPPDSQHPPDTVAAVAPYDVTPTGVEVAPAAAELVETHEGFLALKSCDASRTITSPEVLAVAQGRGASDASRLVSYDAEFLELQVLPAPPNASAFKERHRLPGHVAPNPVLQRIVPPEQTQLRC